MEEKIVELLSKLNKTISFAESCTSGLLSSRITSVSGSSKVFRESFIVYSNESKMKYLNVSNETLLNYGAVSIEVCTEMVEGLIKQTGSDLAIATSSILGPGGGSSYKPVGTSFYTIKYDGVLHSFHYQFNGSRNEIRNNIVKSVLKDILGVMDNDI